MQRIDIHILSHFISYEQHFPNEFYHETRRINVFLINVVTWWVLNSFVYTLTILFKIKWINIDENLNRSELWVDEKLEICDDFGNRDRSFLFSICNWRD